MSWEVNLEDNTVRHSNGITVEFIEKDGEWRGMLGPTKFQPEGGLPLREFVPLLKEADDAFREAKGLPIQEWDFLEEEDDL